MTTDAASSTDARRPGGAIAVLWTLGLAVIIAHTAILVLAGFAIERGWIFPLTRTDPITKVALWVIGDSRYHFFAALILNIPVAIAYIRCRNNRLYRWLMFAVFVGWSIWLAAIAASVVWLIPRSPIELRYSTLGVTYRSFSIGDLWAQLGAHAFLALPLIIYCMRWLVLIWPPYRRQLSRSRGGMCAQCGYDLQGIASANCPECGAPTADRGTTTGSRATPLNSDH